MMSFKPNKWYLSRILYSILLNTGLNMIKRFILNKILTFFSCLCINLPFLKVSLSSFKLPELYPHSMLDELLFLISDSFTILLWFFIWVYSNYSLRTHIAIKFFEFIASPAKVNVIYFQVIIEGEQGFTILNQ